MFPIYVCPHSLKIFSYVGYFTKYTCLYATTPIKSYQFRWLYFFDLKMNEDKKNGAFHVIWEEFQDVIFLKFWGLFLVCWRHILSLQNFEDYLKTLSFFYWPLRKIKGLWEPLLTELLSTFVLFKFFMRSGGHLWALNSLFLALKTIFRVIKIFKGLKILLDSRRIPGWKHFLNSEVHFNAPKFFSDF